MNQLNKKTILIYYNSGLMSIDLLSLMIELQKVNYNVIFLTNSPKGALHNELENKGIATYSKTFEKNKLFYFKHIFYLARFIRKHKVDIVYSHIQINNFITSITQYISKASFYMCRHHSDYVWNGNVRSAKLMDKIINRFSKNIVAISDKVYQQLVDVENVSPKKVHRINLGYDFDLYASPNSSEANTIKSTYSSSTLLLNIGRLIPLKRQALLIEACSILIKKGVDLKLIILGEGTEYSKLDSLVKLHNLQENIFLLGYHTNVMDYIEAADLIIHPSESEASSTIGKEVGLAKKTIMACNNVGDFSTYMNTENSFLIEKKLTPLTLSSAIENAIKDKDLLIQKGKLLNQIIISSFDIKRIIKSYQNLFK